MAKNFPKSSRVGGFWTPRPAAGGSKTPFLGLWAPQDPPPGGPPGGFWGPGASRGGPGARRRRRGAGRGRVEGSRRARRRAGGSAGGPFRRPRPKKPPLVACENPRNTPKSPKKGQKRRPWVPMGHPPAVKRWCFSLCGAIPVLFCAGNFRLWDIACERGCFSGDLGRDQRLV